MMDKLRSECKIEKITNGFILYYKDCVYNWVGKYFSTIDDMSKFLKENYYKEY